MTEVTSLARHRSDPLTQLFLGTGKHPLLGYCLLPSATKDVATRMREVLDELCGMGGRFDDPKVYATALHALALDLCHATAAPTNGRTHPAHVELVQEINDRWADE